MQLTIVGTGYVGLVTAVCFAEKGHSVTCIDIDEEKIKNLKQGIPTIFEDGLPELIRRNAGRISYVSDGKKAYSKSDCVFICVGTPEKQDGSANLKFVWNVVKDLAVTVKHRCTVVIKSTVPVGTNAKISKYLAEHKQDEAKFSVVSNPEFLSQGTAVHDTLHASRIVIGIADDYAKKQMEEVYQKFDAPKLFVNPQSAEMIKYASNDFLALKISYINEIANLCELVGADIGDVATGMGFDKRIGEKFLQAGVGYGGSCFPKDTKALHWMSSFYDKELKTIKAAIEVNEQQKLLLIKKARKYYDSFEGLKISVLGATFKPGTDDLRDAPSLVSIPIFLDDGADVKVYDPVGENNLRKVFKDEITYCKTPQETLVNADMCFIFTEWDEIKNLKYADFTMMKKVIIFDGRNCYDINTVGKYPVIYESIGRRIINNLSDTNV